ncbi:DUF4136 domain-containing protein [Cupriavidus agavae]|uniref:Uncharacterized protein DUF4136 n=1 Tax=Cupriavidus agavae TaxID=1001822 RepID=A0A4V2FI01_9BURK|nr:DUF4136 domain-containing protein [Cupriavidus agavae]RZT42059.1 uncharacterized protein DUF4136 [Cupriavidus agavae]
MHQPNVLRNTPATRVLPVAGTLLAALVLTGCATGPDIRTDYNRSADFAQYRTFGFVPRPGTDRQGYESLTTQYLKAATSREMAARGYEYVPRQPDLLINFNMQFHQRIASAPAPLPPPGYLGYYSYRGGLYAPWPGYGFYNDTYTYTEGTLNIDVIDARKNQLVWEGIAQGDVNQADPQNNQPAIDKVVGQIFAKYPFRAGQPAPAGAPPAK